MVLNSTTERKVMKILKSVVTALLLCVATQGYATSEEWVRHGGIVSQAEQNAMNRQKTASEEDLWREGDHWQDLGAVVKRWNVILRGWNGLAYEDIAWGQEKRPVKSRIVVLDIPLRKTTGPNTVEVEWFHSPISNTGTGNPWGSSLSYIMQWWSSILKKRKSGETIPVEFQFRMVGKGPLLLRGYNEQRKLFQEMVYAWGDLEVNFESRALSAYIALQERSQKSRISGINARWIAKRVLREAGHGTEGFRTLPVEEWEGLIDREETRERSERADSRYLEMMTKAAKQHRRMRTAPQDPMLLINGRYLLTGWTTRNIRDLFRMANWIIRKEIERIPSYGFKPEEIQWGIERSPKREELVHLRQPFPTGNGIEIEWMYSYISAEGEPEAVRWMWNRFWNWRDSLEEEGIEVTMRKAPIINGEGWVKEHQRVHQETATSWKPSFWLRRNHIHMTLAEYLETNPDGIGTHEEAGKLLQERANINHKIYDAARTGSTSDASELAMLKTKGEMLERVRKRNRTRRGPAFLINGEYVLLTKNVTDAFQTLNWAVRKLHEGS